VKESGLGREGSKYGMDEFLEIKIYVLRRYKRLAQTFQKASGEHPEALRFLLSTAPRGPGNFSQKLVFRS